jgi:hypothetical protein
MLRVGLQNSLHVKPFLFNIASVDQRLFDKVQVVSTSDDFKRPIAEELDVRWK